MSATLQSVWTRLFPPIPTSVRDEFLLLSATRLQSQSRHLFLAMLLTIPMVLYASIIIPGTNPMIRYGVPLAMGTSCLIGFISLLKDRNASDSPEEARKFIKEATFFSATICILVSVWCVTGWYNAPEAMKLYFPFTLAMGSLTTIYNLATIRAAAISNVIIGIMPITLLMLLSGDPIGLSAGASLVMVTTFLLRLITLQNDQFVKLLLLQNEMKQLADTDPLTGLYNRRALAEHLDLQTDAPETGATFAIALIDLDGFKPVNDQYGHAVGDKLLVEIARRFKNTVGDQGIVARTGGDEFAILLPRGSSIPHSAIAEQMLTQLITPCAVDGHFIRVGASIGTASWPEDGRDAKSLFEKADKALYLAKAKPADKIQVRDQSAA